MVWGILAAAGLAGSSSSSSKSNEQSADDVYAALIREDLDRYNTELQPLEEFYHNQLTGPQSEQNRTNLLQTVQDQTGNSFDRAQGRVDRRNRVAGLQTTQNDRNRLERHRGLAQAKGATDAGRFYDTLTSDLL